jgi:peptide/nickel transport system permease protein
MIGENIRYWLKDFWKEFRRVPSGLVGLGFLVFFIACVEFEPLLIPFSQTNKKWSDITYWDDNPQGAPPAWTNWFAAKKSAVSTVLHPWQTDRQESGDVVMLKHAFAYDFPYDLAPRDVILHFSGTGMIPLSVSVTRPDGAEIQLYQDQASLSEGDDYRISLSRNAGDAVFAYIRETESEEAMSLVDSDQIAPVTLLFAKAAAGMEANQEPLKGKYVFTLMTMLLSSESKVENPYFVVSGRVSGILGTDTSKRDLWSGVIAGVKWALLIGLLTSVVAVAIGVIYGITSAYFGGILGSVMQRIFEVFVNMPVLPILIVMSAVFKPSIWFLIFMMCCFFWVGPVKTVGSMALQIKEETYIEASRALGAGHGRIIFRHMVPLLIPYSFASMALYVPSAVVYEATVSLLGLGDASIVTWGQILHDALTGGAVLNGLWWWVVPPGIMISLMGMTFSFIGFAMDTILHPKLRTR